MSIPEKEIVDMKVDVEVLKTQVSTIVQLCQKMDTVIDKVISNQDKLINQIYEDMDKKNADVNTDIKELHSRMNTVSRDLSDKVELTERRIMEEIKILRTEIKTHNDKEDRDIKQLFRWRWMVAGGILVIAWLISHMDSGIILKLLK